MSLKLPGGRSEELAESYTLLAEKSVSRNLKGWSAEDIAEAQELVRAAKGSAGVDGEFDRDALALARSLRRRRFANAFSATAIFLSTACWCARAIWCATTSACAPSSNGATGRSSSTSFRTPIRFNTKFCFTWPNSRGQTATDWRQVKVEPGKIFVVGDPKQSIYAFRRADIEAYLEVVEKIIKAQNGVECRLTTNFRSDAAILDAVNGVFEKLIQAQDGVQPPYIAIHPAPGRPSTTASHLAKVAVRKIVTEREINAETARRLEGESLARWLKEIVLDKTMILNAQGESVYAQPKDIAILFRKLTDIHDYLEPFRLQGIRYVVEGERHFYAAKEIIDVVNLLRAVENPFDRLALVGVLRSPLGGLTDQQVYELHRQNLLDYRAAEKLERKNFPPTLAQLYKALDTIER